MMRCVVLAGGVNRRPLYDGYQPDYKAVLQIGGKPLLVYVLEALKQSRVSEVGVVGDRERLKPFVGERRVESGGESLVESIKAALGFFPDDERVLLCTADLPMLRGEMVDRFLRDCPTGTTGYEDELFLSVVPREHFVGAFATCGKNFNTFRGLALCHGNLALASPGILKNPVAMGRIEALYATRTNPVKNALALGVDLGLAYLVGVHLMPLLSLERFAGLLSRRFNIGMAAVRSPFPEIAVDIDEPGDLEIARRRLA